MSNDITEIEKQFFDTFEIKPELTFYDLIRLKEDTGQEFGGRCSANWHGETKEETIRRLSPRGWKVLECKDVYTYPQITDHILLELICVLGSIFISVQDKETLKDHILNQCIMNKDVIKHQVQALFKENNQ